jgi:hypothetical protein
MTGVVRVVTIPSRLFIKMSDCLTYDESLRHRILRTPFGVVKKAKRGSKAHDVLTQRRFHALAYKLLREGGYTILYTPELSDDQTQYEMRLVDTRKPLWLAHMPHQDSLLKTEVVRFWKEMYSHGFALYDFELYEQPTGRVAILDFDSVGFHMTGTNEKIVIPGKEIPPRDYFIHPCFSPDFEEKLNMRLPVGVRNISS